MAQVADDFTGSRLHPLVLMSDPQRTPDILELAAQMPRRSALIYRHFGTPGLELELREITRLRGVQLLIGNDPELAKHCAADGVHFTRETSGATLHLWRSRERDWIISAAGAKTGLDQRPVQHLDAIFLSSVFPSKSPSAGPPMGLSDLKTLAAQYACPVFALGGIHKGNAAELIGSGISGIASIGGLAAELRTRKMAHTPKQNFNDNVTIHKESDAENIVFTAQVAGATETGTLTLRRVSDGVWNANHTGVPKAIGGKGVGKALIYAMVEDARAQGYRVVPGCPFVAKLFERKPEWADGVAA